VILEKLGISILIPNQLNSKFQNKDNSSLPKLSNSSLDLVQEPKQPFSSNHLQSEDLPSQKEYHNDYIVLLFPLIIVVCVMYPNMSRYPMIVHPEDESPRVPAMLYRRISPLANQEEIVDQ
jgi:hypothetical protein